MKRTIQASIIVLLVLAAGVAAADTAAVAVSARVVGACRFNSGATMAFGDLLFDAAGTPLGTGPMTTTLTFWCTRNANYSIIDDAGENEGPAGTQSMKSINLATTEYIPYTLTYAPATGTGAGPVGNDITLTLTGEVGPVYGANTPDDYADRVTLTITP